MDKKLLDILVCPVSGAAVSIADAQVLARVNALIAAGELRYVDETAVTEPLQVALITSDRSMLYRVHDGIPMMLPERGIELAPPA